MHRRLTAGVEGRDEPDDQGGGFAGLSEASSDGLAGLRALHASGWSARSESTRQEHDEELIVEQDIPTGKRVEAGVTSKLMLAAAAVFVLALIPRLIFLYAVTDPDVMIPSWSNDTWHRWQIAYLSSEIGLQQTPARLWDLKGLEYFWGVVHPLLSSALFAVTGSVDVMVLRWMTMLAGAGNIVFLFLIGRRYWNREVGWAAALIGIANPLIIFNDPSGMVEPLSFVFLLAGIYFFPERSFLVGLLWGLAAMTRAEAWLMSAGLVFAVLLAREGLHRKIAVFVGWLIPVGLYMKHLAHVTGNAIYPIYWNFLANAAGRWEFREELTDYQIAARPVLAAVFLISALAAAWILWKRPRGYLIYLLGAGTTAFITGFIGLTAYLKSYEPWFWLTRFFVFPYLFAGLVIAVLAFKAWPPKPNRLSDGWRSWGVVAAAVLLLQVAWSPVLLDVDPGYTSQTRGRVQEQQGREVARWYSRGTVLVPEGEPQLTYAIVRYGEIEGVNILGQMYGPDYYFDAGDPLDHWDEVEPMMLDWVAREDVRLLLASSYNPLYLRLVNENPDQFKLVSEVPYKAISIYLVEQ